MFNVDPDAARRLAAAIKGMHQEQVRTHAVDGFTQAVFEAANNDDVDLLTRLELIYSNGETSAEIGVADHLIRVPSDVPVALRVARQMALETGRVPRITIGVNATLDLEKMP